MKIKSIVIIIASLMMLSICAQAQGPISPLRLAINDLIKTYDKAYPHGQEFLSKLDKFEANEIYKANLEQLQREALIANPLVSAKPILFVVRKQYAGDHHNTETMFEIGQNNIDGKFTGGSALKLIDLASGRVKTLIDLPEGLIRDPEIYFSAKKIVFSMRKNRADSYHIYEINANGSGLKGLTTANGVSDIDPIYMPNDNIVFTSTRDPKIVGCNVHVVCNLFGMESDGANIRQLSKNPLFDGHPSLMPDGRILYDRWEYVDRAFGDAQGLWTANPDGTNLAVYYGNNTPSPGGVIDGKIIPGTDFAVASLVCCHDRPWGAIGIIDRSKGLDGRTPIIKTWPANAIDFVRDPGAANAAWDLIGGANPKYEDPYPLSSKYFLCSRMTGNDEQMGIYLLDIFGNEILLHQEAPGCYDPMPLIPRTRPQMIPSKRKYDTSDGAFYIQNVYLGTHMKSVEPGIVKYLRVVETPPKIARTYTSWGGQGVQLPGVNWHDFMNKRILGTVPVEADGSVSFSAPSDKFIYFQLLDKDGMMVQSMRSGALLQPGEKAGCIGCHEDRRTASPTPANPPIAFKRAPSKLKGWYGPARNFNYLSEIQPIFDKNCVSCHDFGKPAGMKLILARDKDFIFNASYIELWRKNYIRVVGAGPAEIQQPYTWGSHASKLIEVIKNGHEDIQLSLEELDRLITWVDINAPYYPDYATAYPNNLAGRSPLNGGQIRRLGELAGTDFNSNASWNGNRGPQISFDRPDLSPCLSQIRGKNEAACKEAIAIIQAGQNTIKNNPDCDMPGFKPCEADAQRLARYKQLEDMELKAREAIRNMTKVYDEK
ncbi:MAG: hypothetical protein NT018_01550 [Armatimonadetes bacterium]|nr:hypothetical protein [Armatimonadota bacterium]